MQANISGLHYILCGTYHFLNDHSLQAKKCGGNWSKIIYHVFILQNTDSETSASMEQTVMGVYVIQKDGEWPEDPEDVGVLIEGVEVLSSLANVGMACALLFGLIYCLNLQYPQDLKCTFEVLQKIVLNLDGQRLSPSSSKTSLWGKQSWRRVIGVWYLSQQIWSALITVLWPKDFIIRHLVNYTVLSRVYWSLFAQWTEICLSGRKAETKVHFCFVPLEQMQQPLNSNLNWVCSLCYKHLFPEFIWVGPHTRPCRGFLLYVSCYIFFKTLHNKVGCLCNAHTARRNC